MPWRRAIRWSIFVACLAALGCGLFTFLPPKPRWTADGVHVPWVQLADGSGVVLAKKPPSGLAVEIVVRDLETGQKRWSFPEDEGFSFRVLSPDGQWVFAESVINEEVRCVNLATGKGWRKTIKDRVERPLFSEDSALLLLFSHLGIPTVFVTSTGELLDKAAKSGYSPLAITPTHVVTHFVPEIKPGHGGNERFDTVRLWDRQTHMVQEYNINELPLAISPDAKTLVTRAVKDSEVISLWRLPTMARRSVFDEVKAKDRSDSQVFFTRDGTHFILHRRDPMAGNTASIYFWQTDVHLPMGVVHDVPTPPIGFLSEFDPLHVPQQMVMPDGRLWIQNSWRSISAFDIASAGKIWQRPSAGNFLGFGARGQRLVLYSLNNTLVEILDASTGELVLGLRTDKGSVRGLIPYVTRNGRYLACSQAMTPAKPGTVEAFIRSWLPASWFPTTARRVSVADTEDGSLLLQREMPCEDVWVSEDGRTLITRSEPEANDKRTITCWDIPFGRHWLAIIGIPCAIGVIPSVWKRMRRHKPTSMPAAA